MLELHEVVNRYKPGKYLEIGVFMGHTLFNSDAGMSIGVDPAPRVGLDMFCKRLISDHNLNRRTLLFPVMSDKFFEDYGDHRFDVILVDGMHEYYQCNRDIVNGMNSLADGGVLLVHDVNPRSEASTCPFKPGIDMGEWNGNVWKSLALLRANGVVFWTLDIPYGLSVIKKQRIKFGIESEDEWAAKGWDYFVENREKMLNLVSEEEWLAGSVRAPDRRIRV